jgi:hypothetical protein
MKTIKLDKTFNPDGSPVLIMVDDEDYEHLRKHTWRLNANQYVVRGNRPPIYLHRELMRKELLEAPFGYELRHINGIKLDNQKSNLRIVSPNDS